MEAGCFERDANGSEIVNLTKSLHNNNIVLVKFFDFKMVGVSNCAFSEVHKFINAIICSLAIFFNALLAVIILKSRAEMFRMRPILWFGLVVDMLSSILNLIASPVSDAFDNE
jgi:hypothetical protein